MALKPAVQFSECGELFDGEVAPTRKNTVPYGADVPVGEEEQVFALPVHRPILGVDVHFLKVQFDQEGSASKGASRVA